MGFMAVRHQLALQTHIHTHFIHFHYKDSVHSLWTMGEK